MLDALVNAAAQLCDAEMAVVSPKDGDDTALQRATVAIPIEA